MTNLRSGALSRRTNGEEYRNILRTLLSLLKVTVPKESV